MGEVFETTDIELAEHVLSDVYGNVRISARGARRGMWLVHTSLTPTVRLDHVSFAMDFDASGGPLGALIFGELKSGLVRHGSDGSDRFCRPGQVFLSAQAGHRYTATIEDAEVQLAVIDPALPSRLADIAPGRTSRPVGFTGYEPVSAQAAAQWRATYAYVRDTVVNSPDAASQPLVAASAARLLVATALVVFPNDAFTDPTIEDRRDGHPATLRRAVTFIDENAHRDVTVADVADAASVTVRAVQLAFQRHMGTTPMGYLRRVRLDRAREDLMRARLGDGLTVTAVAYRWGFLSSSRFAAAYRQAYGVLPSHTLHQD